MTNTAGTRPRKKIIFVLGMHRSGTSLIAKAAQVAGAELGDKLMKPSDDNPKGFWEDIDIFQFNERLLQSLDIRWDIPSVLPTIDFSDNTFASLKREAIRILAPKVAVCQRLAIKDPRICLLMPFWMDVTQTMKLEVQFVVAVRHPVDVAQSLSTRDQLDEKKSLTLWLNYNFLILKNLSTCQEKKLFVDYQKLLTEPADELARMTRFICGTQQARSTETPGMQTFLNEFIDPTLCHSASDQGALYPLDERVPGLLSLYQCVQAFTHGHWSKDKAETVLETLSGWQLEANNYRLQLHTFNTELHQSLKKQHQLLEKEKQAALELVRKDKDDVYTDIIKRKDYELQEVVERKDGEILSLGTRKDNDIQMLIINMTSEFKQVIERKDHELDEKNQASEKLKETQTQKIAKLEATQSQKIAKLEATQSQKIAKLEATQSQKIVKLEAAQTQEITKLKAAQAQEIATQKNTNQLECSRLQTGWNETDRHLQGTLETIKAIEQSLSYRLGRTLTWFIRMPYDLITAPFQGAPGNFRLLRQIIYFILRHPLKSIRLLSWIRLKNAYITFFQNPAIAQDVVNHYSRLLHGDVAAEDYLLAVEQENRTRPLADIDLNSRTVSLITVNYNGRKHLFDLLTSLQNQDYQDREIILVDNASNDDSVEFVHSKFPQVRVIALSENVGFAEANNIAAELAVGRYYCLVNNDTQASPAWLSQLVNCIESSDNIGAVGPKILFWQKFASIKLTLAAKTAKLPEVYLDIEALETSAQHYPKFFFTDGLSEELSIDGKRCRKLLSHSAELRVPVCAEQSILTFRLYNPNKKQIRIEISSPALTKPVTSTQMPGSWHSVNIDFTNSLDSDQLYYLINNAGSQVNESGEVRDRGFAAPDINLYNQEEKVSALCGGAMLIRPEALQDKPIFSEHFFAYFEDTDASLRIRKAGYELVYCPNSIIYHKHASTTQEHSPFFRFHVERNKILFYALHFPEPFWKDQWQQSQAHLNHLQHYWQNNGGSDEDLQFSAMIPQLLSDWVRMLPLIEQGQFYDRPQRLPKIAVYDNFWCTLGGGEHHASVIAQALQNLGRVDLLSEQPFEIADLEQQFGVDLRHCRRRLLTSAQLHHDPETTRQYDIFINSTYSSDLQCYSRYSFYIVSFPFNMKDRPVGSDQFLQTYTAFLANSRYTAGWIKKWWQIESQVLYPTINPPTTTFNHIKKTKLILNVGRFFLAGHNKKQLELVQSFRILIDKGDLSTDWQLVLVGQVDASNQHYVDQVRQAAGGYPVEIINNLPLQQLQQLYTQAAIYWHATGLGEDLDKRPELYEHFGITTVEAMSYGCIPIVINAGGQPESVDHEKNGFLFDNPEQLQTYTRTCASLFVNDNARYKTLSQAAYQQARRFGRDTMPDKLSKLLETTDYPISYDITVY